MTPPLNLVVAAAALALGYLVAGTFSTSLAGWMAATAVALVALCSLVVAHHAIRTAADVARIRSDLAQWMRDPKAADPEDSYLARIARAVSTRG